MSSSAGFLGPVLECSRFVAADQVPDDTFEKLEQCWNATAALLSEIGVGELPQLDVLEISIVDDEQIADVHGRFLDDPTPTDVITFPHGEILVSADTAQRQAREFATEPMAELALYGIHGMLHLAGFDDKKEADAKKMAARQQELLEQFWRGEGP